jgi:thiolase-like protein
LAAGLPESVADVTINRFCASSLSATINVEHAIKAGDLGVSHRLPGRIDVPIGLGLHER